MARMPSLSLGLDLQSLLCLFFVGSVHVFVETSGAPTLDSQSAAATGSEAASHPLLAGGQFSIDTFHSAYNLSELANATIPSSQARSCLEEQIPHESHPLEPSAVRANLMEGYYWLISNITQGDGMCFQGLLAGSTGPSKVGDCYEQCSTIVEGAKVVAAQIRRIVYGLDGGCGECDDNWEDGCENDYPDFDPSTPPLAGVGDLACRIRRASDYLKRAVLIYKNYIDVTVLKLPNGSAKVAGSENVRNKVALRGLQECAS